MTRVQVDDKNVGRAKVGLGKEIGMTAECSITHPAAAPIF